MCLVNGLLLIIWSTTILYMYNEVATIFIFLLFSNHIICKLWAELFAYAYWLHMFSILFHAINLLLLCFLSTADKPTLKLKVLPDSKTHKAITNPMLIWKQQIKIELDITNTSNFGFVLSVVQTGLWDRGTWLNTELFKLCVMET